ncbi:MAG: phage major capsid protein [Microcella sp.]|uniref:phage major capsid protein n=1 Tax=Microcella sp. TaxID=1913979 RepID=UPI0033155FD0
MAIIMENLKRLLDERANAWETEGKPLTDIASERAFTAEEQEKFDRASEAFDGYTQRIKALELTVEQERAVKDFGDMLKSDEQVRKAMFSELRSVLVQRASVSADMEFTGRDLNAALRNLSVGTDSAGGNTAAPDFLAELIRPLRNFSSVLGAGARIITTANGNDLTMPSLATPGAAAVATEGNTIGGTDATFAQKVLKAYKFGQYMGISRELMDDSAIDIEALVIALIGENIGALLGQKLAVGAGTTETAGLFTAATVGKTGAVGQSGAFTFDDIIDVEYSIPAPYRANASWLFADGAIKNARKLKDGNDQYLWQPSTQAGQPDRLNGKPLFSDAYVADPANGARSFGFGDVSRYWVRFVNSMRIERSEHALFGSDQVAFRGVLRADGILTDASAFKVFAGGAAS